MTFNARYATENSMRHTMIPTTKKITYPLILGGVLTLSMMLAPLTYADDTEPSNTLPTEETTPATSNFQNYSGLADLVTMICDDAQERFQGFYGSTVVKVEPFSTIGFYERNKQSELGMALADQMTAIINTDTLANRRLALGTTTQKLNGVLQEVDGYLRIHISGVNTAGERTSYVVSVEMSEPIYRALHTYL